MKGRGHPVAVPRYWLEECREWVRANDETTRSLGPKLADALSRSRPFSKATVARFLRGEKVTYEIAQAFSIVAGLPLPLPSPKNEEQRRWFELGSELDELDRDLFLEELDHVEKLVDASRVIAERKVNRPEPHE